MVLDLTLQTEIIAHSYLSSEFPHTLPDWERRSIKGPSRSGRGRALGSPVWGQTAPPSDEMSRGRSLPGELRAGAGGDAPAPTRNVMSLERSHFETS